MYTIQGHTTKQRTFDIMHFHLSSRAKLSMRNKLLHVVEETARVTAKFFLAVFALGRAFGEILMDAVVLSGSENAHFRPVRMGIREQRGGVCLHRVLTRF